MNNSFSLSNNKKSQVPLVDNKVLLQPAKEAIEFQDTHKLLDPHVYVNIYSHPTRKSVDLNSFSKLIYIIN